ENCGGGGMVEWLRQFRLFGHNAPRSYLAPAPVAADTRDVRWTRVEEGDVGYTFDLDNVFALQLDAVYADLKVGAWVLVAAPDTRRFARIESIVEVNATKGPLNDTVTKITLATGSTGISTENLRAVTVYELAGGDGSPRFVPLWGRKYADAFATDTIYVEGIYEDALARGHALILDDEKNRPQTVTCTGVAREEDGPLARLRVTFTPALTRELDTTTAVLYGNVALATHGETVASEVLGNGDASAAFQSFGVRKSPVTFVPQPGARHGAANSLQARVGGVLWHEVRNLYGRGGDERVFTTSVDEEGKMSLRFGDGNTGARLASGRDNVVARYRQGIGEGGNVGAGSLRTLLDRPVGLKGVTNPARAGGGADPETLGVARTNAPDTVRTLGRIVSLRDFEDAAREHAGVAKARATWTWEGEEQVVRLTVAGDGGDEIVDKPYENLVKELDARRDPNRKLVVASYHEVPVQVEAAIEVDPDHVVQEVQAAARNALEAYFAFDNLQFGQPVHLSDVYRVLQEVSGVVAVTISILQFEEESDRTGRQPTIALVQAHLRIDPGELAQLAGPVTISAREART
ncbi:MAG: putative baseplate assembly protein, partial [Rubrobacteraceae bacterium]|nr:putative baseplate assembly protein [Rubrobacteraceae bacterium]